MERFHRRAQIVRMDDMPYGYTHNVMVWTSLDGGNTWYYCGIGRYVKSEAEAEAVVREYKRQTVWHGPHGDCEIIWED